jgi:hypothetical protein
MSQSPHVRCRHCDAVLPGWLPWAKRPHATLLMGYLQLRHPEAFRPLLARMATEPIDRVVMEAFARVQTASQHYLPPWGMKPTVLDQRNLLDLYTLTLTH